MPGDLDGAQAPSSAHPNMQRQRCSAWSHAGAQFAASSGASGASGGLGGAGAPSRAASPAPAAGSAPSGSVACGSPDLRQRLSLDPMLLARSSPVAAAASSAGNPIS
jgi:hypothetical protein